MKKCLNCKKTKPFSDFYIQKNGYYQSLCKKCRYKYNKNHPEYKERSKKWLKKDRQENPEKYKRKQKEYRKKYYNKKKLDFKYNFDRHISTAICNSLKGKKKGRKWETLVGYNINDLITHLEKQFDSKMNWENYGNYWQIDHKKPISLFKYKTTKNKEFKKCWSLQNLHPMEKIENLKKGNRFISE